MCTHCDNSAVVEIITNGRARDCLLCHQLRALFFISAYFQFEITAAHTPGEDNGATDALSRNNLSSFFSQVPSAALSPTQVPLELQLGLSTDKPAWRSREWTSRFSSTITQQRELMHWPKRAIATSAQL